ncbi:hypothetical protein C8Q76DRAFT_640422 [Earliella scabrosa]|nr:hypothetical protein C8Q76DRAFT_640422 [Earliella scabrosa]
MSVHLLYNPGVPSSIADELESFLHVMVYGAFRRMRSTLYTIKGFNDQYFAGCILDDAMNRITCPNAKRESVMTLGVLTSGNNPVKFFSRHGKATDDHPLNNLIAELLAVFHARYVVDAWEKRANADPKTPVRNTGREQLQTIHEEDEDLAAEMLADFATKQIATTICQDPSPVGPKEPTPQMYKDAASLADHRRVRDIIYNYLFRGSEWPPKDVIEDRMITDIVESSPSQPTPPQPPSAQPPSAQPPLPPPPPEAPAPPLPQESEPDNEVPKPAKRQRRGPTQQAAAGPSTQAGRVTRSRSAANVAPTTVVAPAVDFHVRPPAVPVAPPIATGCRVTRSQSRTLGNQAVGSGTTNTDNGATTRGRTTSTSRRLTRNATGANMRSGGPSRGDDSARGRAGAKSARRGRVRRT